MKLFIILINISIICKIFCKNDNYKIAVKDSFNYCKENSNLYNCEKKDCDDLKKLINQDDEFYQFKDKVLYYKSEKLYETDCQKVKDITVEFIEYCIEHLPVSFSINNLRKSGYLDNQGIIR